MVIRRGLLRWNKYEARRCLLYPSPAHCHFHFCWGTGVFGTAPPCPRVCPRANSNGQQGQPDALTMIKLLNDEASRSW
jgi:hypothetical protein